MARVHVGVGSNLGERETHCRKAIEHMQERGISVRKVSSMYETEPWGVEEQPRFINMAVEAESSLSPEALLAVLKEIEKAMGREETVRYGPRTIDLDILLYDDLVVETETLHLPHPLLHRREFVLLPLCEIAADVIHPVLKKTIRELREGLSDG